MRHWQIVQTPHGEQLVVDGTPMGSAGELPPSGWLQRVYGVTMPIEYERLRTRDQQR